MVGIAVAGQGYDVDAFARDTGAFLRDTGKPVAAAVPQAAIAARFVQEGIPVYPTESEAVAALGQFLNHVELMRTATRAGIAPALRRGVDDGRMLNEADSLALAARFDLPVVEHRLCRSADEAAAAFAQLDAPVVVKGCSRDIVHKTELGIVHLALADERAVRSAFAQVKQALESRGRAFDGAIVARMVRGRRELMLGARLDPVFGALVIVGDGGKYVEVMPDARVLLWPFDEEDVLRALTRLRIAPLFAGVRGEPALDVGSVAQTVVAAGRMVANPQAGVISMDFNPLMVGARGEDCRILDGVVCVVTA
jgi:acyl-CoA synthetase (NDP forming)